jgi:hypothetical protein
MHIAALPKRAGEADAKIKRLYNETENGVADLSDPMPKDRITELKTIRDQASTDAGRAGSSFIWVIGPFFSARMSGRVGYKENNSPLAATTV